MALPHVILNLPFALSTCFEMISFDIFLFMINIWIVFSTSLFSFQDLMLPNLIVFDLIFMFNKLPANGSIASVSSVLQCEC